MSRPRHRRHQVLAVFARLQARMGVSPTIDEVAAEIGANKNTIKSHIQALTKDGHLVRVRSGPRGLTLANAAPEGDDDKLTTAYVAGASAELGRCQAFMDRLERAGVWITRDWTAAMQAALSPDHEMSDQECRRHATADLHGIKTARMFVLLVPEAESTGCWFELGYAIAQEQQAGGPRLRTVAIGPRRSIFVSLCEERFATEEDFFAWFEEQVA